MGETNTYLTFPATKSPGGVAATMAEGIATEAAGEGDRTLSSPTRGGVRAPVPATQSWWWCPPPMTREEGVGVASPPCSALIFTIVGENTVGSLNTGNGDVGSDDIKQAVNTCEIIACVKPDLLSRLKSVALGAA